MLTAIKCETDSNTIIVGDLKKPTYAGVQLQQPGNQPEEMGGVSEKQGSLSVFLDGLFISSLRFSFILLQKH